MSNGGIIGPANDPVNETVSAPGSVTTFNSSGTFTPFSAPATAGNFRTANVLVVAGGRGGGANINSGGGAGFVQFNPAHSIPASTAPITIGSGGGNNGNGGASTAGFSSPVAAPTGTFPPRDGNGNGTFSAGGATTPTGTRNGGAGSGGDGGGPGSAGAGGIGTEHPGVSSPLNAGGGGGGAYPGQPAGPGTNGGGSGNASVGGAGSAASVNTGAGGGGGGGNNGSGGSGGSGFVKIKELDISVQTASGVWQLNEQFDSKKAGTWPS